MVWCLLLYKPTTKCYAWLQSVGNFLLAPPAPAAHTSLRTLIPQHPHPSVSAQVLLAPQPPWAWGATPAAKGKLCTE